MPDPSPEHPSEHLLKWERRTGLLQRTDSRRTIDCQFCSKKRFVKPGKVDYVDSEGTLYCMYCWADAKSKTIRSTRKKNLLPGPKHWEGRTLYYLMKKLPLREESDLVPATTKAGGGKDK